MDVYLNGRMLPPEQATIRLDDAGLQHGVGLFETMAAYHGQVFRLHTHLARLAQSARELGLAEDLDAAPLAEAVRQTIAHKAIDRARLRLTVTPGAISLLRPAADTTGNGATGVSPTPTVAVVPTEPTQYDPAYFERGVMVLIAGPSANPFDPTAGHKTLAYWSRLRTLRQAAAAGAGEAIWLNVTNHLASGAVSNLFLVKDGGLLTPLARGEDASTSGGTLPAPVLPGITRAAVIEVAEAEQIPVTRRMLTINDLLEADEVFLTNSSWLVLPVTRVEKKEVGGGSVGPVTVRIREMVMRLIERETTASH